MKGVSPVVATVLMVAVAIAAAVVAYSWFMSMQASVQAEASRGAGTVGKERFTVEPIACSSGALSFKLRNIGDEAINGEFTFNVKDASTGIVIGTYSTTLNIPEGGTADVTIPATSSGLTTACKVSSTGSNRIIVEAVAPGGASASREERIS